MSLANIKIFFVEFFLGEMSLSMPFANDLFVEMFHIVNYLRIQFERKNLILLINYPII